MAGEFEPRPLGTVAKVRSGFAFKSEEMGDSGLPIIKIKNIVPPTVDVSNCERIPEETIEGIQRSERYELEEGDTLIAMTGATVGKVGRFPKTRERYFLNQRVGKVYLTAPHAADYRYIYYVLSQGAYVRKMFGIADGSAQANISGPQIENLEVPLPPLPTQRAIAHILGTLDDKIELNRRMNRTLEAIARAIFQSWFVDFDPVHRNAARKRNQTPPPSPLPLGEGGRRPGEGALDDIDRLFPDSFEDSELGMIPRGWGVRALPEIFEINPKRPLSKGQVAPYLDMSNMPTKGPNPEEWVMREAGSGMKFINGDTLVARITPCLENGKTAFVDFLENGQVGWGSTEYIILRPKGYIPPIFGYLLARSEEFRTFAILQMSGSSGRQRVPAESLGNFKLPAPEFNASIFPLFGKQIEPMSNRMNIAAEQSRTLASLRDALLPKLISGELPVRDAEHLIERRV